MKAGPQVVVLGREPGSKGWAELPPEGEIDVLFLHAHPDDEAIDFGGLLARLSQKGKRTGVVLFTDGESGLSRGPYAGRDLPPKVLSSVRVREAEASLSELGCSLYVRLGYRNHPYSSSTQVLSTDEVFRAWGGREQLVRQLALLIEKLGPEVVVSVDGNSRVLIHFEHEAVGIATAEALELLEREKKSPVRGYLLAINPRHRREYSEALPVSVMSPAGGAGELPVSVQLRALKRHLSQIDAGVVALEYMPFFENTWLKKVFWNLETGVEEFF
jgi:LmbE family N-acetylglucosaminyl deacetylase